MGVTIEMDAPDEATRARLAHQWSRAVVDGDDSDPPVVRVAVTPGVTEDDHARDYALTTQLTMAALLATMGERINLHAGGLGDERGRVLALVGASGSGKTTATRLLAQRLAYLSDETVSIGRDRQVSAHPKPLSVIVDPDNPFHKEQLSPDDLGLLPTPSTGTLERLVMLHRGSGRRGLVRLDTVTAMRELIAQSSSLREVPNPLETLLQLVRDCGGAWALEYDEIGDHLDELVRLLADAQPPPDDPEIEPRRHPGIDDTGMDEIASGPDLSRAMAGRPRARARTGRPARLASLPPGRRHRLCLAGARRAAHPRPTRRRRSSAARRPSRCPHHRRDRRCDVGRRGRAGQGQTGMIVP